MKTEYRTLKNNRIYEPAQKRVICDVPYFLCDATVFTTSINVGTRKLNDYPAHQHPSTKYNFIRLKTSLRFDCGLSLFTFSMVTVL